MYVLLYALSHSVVVKYTGEVITDAQYMHLMR